MIFRIRGFTLIELMMVIAIIAILASSIYTSMSGYFARGRDVSRISDIKDLSLTFQNYSRTRDTYPNNTNQFGSGSYCVSDILTWPNALSQYPDRQYAQLGWLWSMRMDPSSTHAPIGPCGMTGSYLYSRLSREALYSVLSARMELQTSWANWSGASLLNNSGYIDDMVHATPLDKIADDPDKIFLIITN